MVPKLIASGKSFKGLAMYLGHDPHAETAERVAWTHTLNCAFDDVASAVHEMLTTYEDADLLKAEAGVRGGGRSMERPVKHLSLNFHPSETPTREQMIAAAQSFLTHMKWQEHQAVIFCHDDKDHHHVHIMLNRVHPVTGLALDERYEHRRAQVWARTYERELGQDFCKERDKPAGKRKGSVPRPAWMRMKEDTERELAAERIRADFDPSYLAREENRRVVERHERQILHDLLKEQRLAFFAEGKRVYGELNRAVYDEVRVEHRAEWSEYYAAKRAGLDHFTLAQVRADLVARQTAVYEERREAAAAELRAARDREYGLLKEEQAQQRADLANRQERGLTSPHLLDRAHPLEKTDADKGQAANENSPPASAETEALDRFGIRRGRGEDNTEHERETPLSGFAASVEDALFNRAPENTPKAPSKDLASGLAGGFLSILGGLSESVSGGHTKASQRQAPPLDPLERFGIHRGRPPSPDEERAKRDKEKERDDDWWAWRKRQLDR